MAICGTTLNRFGSIPLLIFAICSCGCGSFRGYSAAFAALPVLYEAFVKTENPPTDTMTIAVLTETRPIFSTFNLRLLHVDRAVTPEEWEQDDARDEGLRATFRPTDVHVGPADARCNWVPADRPYAEYAGTSILLLELSNVVENPFESREAFRAGLFARLSVGGSPGASWFWVALHNGGSEWRVSGVWELDIDDA